MPKPLTRFFKHPPEKVRIPHADQSLYPIPSSITNEEVLVMLSDVFPTALRSVC